MDKKRQIPTDAHEGSTNADLFLQTKPSHPGEPFSWPVFFASLHQNYSTSQKEQDNEKPTLQ